MGVRSKQQLDESRRKGIQDLSAKNVKSSKRFLTSPSAKLIVIGKYCAGKTSLVRAMKEQRPVFIPEGPSGRTKGIEVSVHQLYTGKENAMLLYAYDFGGQPSYFPLHQVFLSPHSLFTLVSDFSKSPTEDLTETAQFYHTVNQRVVKPVYINVGTKIDLSHGGIEDKKNTLMRALKEIENKDINALNTRAKRLEKAIEQLTQDNAASSSLSYEFQGLSKEKLYNKLTLVNTRLQNRPRLPDDVFVVSSHKYQGIEQLQREISRIIRQNADLFPSFSIPFTWFGIQEQIKLLKQTRACMDLSEFKRVCRRNKVSDEGEVYLLLDYFRIKGLLIHYSDHAVGDEDGQLSSTVFIDPHHVTYVLSLIYDHEHYDTEFWEKMVSKCYMPTDQCEEARSFVSSGVVSETLLECMLKGTKMESQVNQTTSLMKEFDLCFELEKSHANITFRKGVRYFLVPSLLTSENSDELDRIWPEKSSSVECILQLYLFTAVEPYGLFDKTSVRLNNLFFNRFDTKGCTVGDIHGFKDKLKMQMVKNVDEKSFSLLFVVRTAPSRLTDTRNTLRRIVADTMELMKYYPTVLWDWYILCPLCKLSMPGSRWPAENTLLSPAIDTPPMNCTLCRMKMDTVGGLPMVIPDAQPSMTDTLDVFYRLLGVVVRMIGLDYRWLIRHLFPCIDDADVMIDQVVSQQIAPSLVDQASGVLREWRQKYGEYASYDKLVNALVKLPRLDILQKAGIEDKEGVKDEETRSGSDSESRKRETVKQVTLLISQEVGHKEWKLLHRELDPSIVEEMKPTTEIIDMDVRDLREKIYTMIKTWRQSYGRKATFKHLISALNQIERTDLAEKVEGMCSLYIVSVLEAMQFAGR